MSKLAAAGLRSTVAGPPASVPQRVTRDRIGAPDGLVERPGPLGVAQPRVAEQGLERGPALADQHGSDGPLRDDRCKGRQVDPLVAAAGDQHDRCRERLERGRHGVRLRPLRVVDEAHAVDDGDGLEAVLDAA